MLGQEEHCCNWEQELIEQEQVLVWVQPWETVEAGVSVATHFASGFVDLMPEPDFPKHSPF